MDLNITGHVTDFDFLAGSWDVHSRRLRERNGGCLEWDEFEATSVCRALLGGGANLEEIDFPTEGFSGLTLRVFDIERSRWSIWWVNSGRGVLDPPVTGGFEGSNGVFHGTDLDDGRRVDVVFRWSHDGPDIARWEQAFAYDGGPWEVNWIMEFTRSTTAG